MGEREFFYFGGNLEKKHAAKGKEPQIAVNASKKALVQTHLLEDASIEVKAVIFALLCLALSG